MVDRWLNRLDIVNNIIVNNRNKRRVYNFDYQKYDEEQFWSRYRLTKVEFQDMRPHNDKGRPIPADVQLLLINSPFLCHWYVPVSMWGPMSNFATISKSNYKTPICNRFFYIQGHPFDLLLNLSVVFFPVGKSAAYFETSFT